MKKIFFAAAFLLTALCGVAQTGSTQQKLVDTKDAIIANRVFFDGQWRYRWFTNGRLQGGVVSWVTGLTFAVTSAKYMIEGREYSSAGGQITLDAAHPSLPRFDVLALNTNGAIVKITGTAGSVPAIPQINQSTQIYLTAIYLPGGATQPTGVSNLTIYDEDTEWPHAQTGFTGGISFASTASPYIGTKSINTTGSGATDVSTSGGMKFANGGTTYGYSNYTLLRFYIKLKAALPSTATLSVALGVGNETLTPITAAHGFNPALANVYQNITVPMAEFNKLGNSFGAFYLIVTGNGVGYYIDNIQLQSGVTNGGGNQQDTFKVASPLYVAYNSTTGDQTLHSDTVSLTKDGILTKEDYALFLSGGSGVVTDSIKLSNDSVFLRKNGVFVFQYMLTGGGSPQTPWAANIDGNQKTLSNVAALEVKKVVAGVNTYAKFNPATFSSTFTFSPDSLTATGITGTFGLGRATIAKSSGKIRMQITVGAGGGNANMYIGIGTSAATGFYLGEDANAYAFRLDGTKINNAAVAGFPAYGSDCTAPGTVVDFTADLTAGTIEVFKNGVSMGVMYSGITAGTYYPAIGHANTTAVVTANFGATPFTYTISGYDGVYSTAGGSTTEILMSDASGNVGVGTQIPTEKLTVTGNTTATGNIYAGSYLATAGNLRIGSPLPVNGHQIDVSKSGSVISTLNTTSDPIAGGGRVWYSAAYAGSLGWRWGLNTGGTGGGGYTASMNYTIDELTGGTFLLRLNILKNSGYVGIGKEFPTARLHIGGKFKADSMITALGGFATTGYQTVTSGTTATISDAATTFTYDPASVQATLTITMPTAPTDGQWLYISFGGTIAAGSPVVTSLTIAPGAGYTLYQALTPTTANGGDVFIYQVQGTVIRRIK